MKYMTLACSCNDKSRSKCKNTFKMHLVTKTNCKASILLVNGKYIQLYLIITINLVVLSKLDTSRAIK